MAQKRWKLAVTEVGTNHPIAEVGCEAGDWMTALTRARAALGEKGGVPPGASCAVAPDGRVTLLDGVARRRYVLSPSADEPAPAVVLEPPASAAPPKKKADLKKTMAYMPGAGAAGMAVPGAPIAPIAVGAAHVASIASAMPEVPPKPVSVAPPKPVSVAPPKPVSVAPASVPPPQAQSAAPVAAVSPAEVPARKKVAKQTMAYMPAEVAAALAAGTGLGGAAATAAPVADAATRSSPAPSTPPASVAGAPVSAGAAAASAAAADAAGATSAARKASKQTVAYMPAQAGAPLPASSPPSPVVAPTEGLPRTPPEAPLRQAPEAAAVAAPTATPTSVSAAPDLEILSSRDGEPTKESPLTYRERNWLVAPGISPDDAEHILRVRFTAIREEIAPRPKGKLVKLALFDHRWSGQPQLPPVLALQWKDWRGEPEIVAPTRVSAPGPVPSAARTSAPSAPTAPAPPAIAEAPPAPIEVSVVVDPGMYASPAPSRPAEPSVMVDPALFAVPSAAPVPVARALPTVPPAAPAGASVHHRQDRLAEAFEALQDLFFLPTPFEGVEFVLRLLSDLVPSEASAIVLYDINTHELRFAGALGAGAEERKGDAVPGDAGLFGAAFQHAERCLVVPDVAHEARFDPGVDGRVGLEATNLAIMPVAAQGRLLGAIQLVNRIGELEFSVADGNLLVYVGQRLGEFLHQHKTSEQKRPTSGAPPRPSRRP